MDFEIIGRHLDVTEEIKDYTNSRLEKAPKIFGRIHGLKAVYDMDGDDYRVEFIAYLVKGNTLVARAAARDIYAAIDAASDKLEAQLRHYKEKLNEHRVKTAPEQAAESDSQDEVEEE